jgi:AcrR family transcriptional regulator
MATRREPNVAGAVRERVGVGRDDLGVECVGEIQRSRMLSAMVEVCAERGLAGVTVAHVVARSGVSRRTFYEQFKDCEDCFLAAVDDGLARVSEYVLPAYRQSGGWRERIRGSLVALLSLLDEDPGTGRLLVVDTLGARHKALQRRGQVLDHVIAAVDEGRTVTGTGKESKAGTESKTGMESRPGMESRAGRASKAGTASPRLVAEGIVGGALSILHARLLVSPQPSSKRGARAGDIDGQSLLELTGPLMSMIVLPYLGPAAARRELEQPAPKPRSVSHHTNGHPLRGLEMRLTYRTIRVLVAVAAQPGGSNRQVADAAGITDQGQISKLLARLHGLGLIENTGSGSVRGAPNSWVLTDKGWNVQSALARNTT